MNYVGSHKSTGIILFSPSGKLVGQVKGDECGGGGGGDNDSDEGDVSLSRCEQIPRLRGLCRCACERFARLLYFRPLPNVS